MDAVAIYRLFCRSSLVLAAFVLADFLIFHILLLLPPKDNDHVLDVYTPNTTRIVRKMVWRLFENKNEMRREPTSFCLLGKP